MTTPLSQFFLADPNTIEPYLQTLAGKLETVCAKRPENFQPGVYAQVTSMTGELREVKTALAATNLASIPIANQDVFDDQIEAAQTLLDSHQLIAARRLLETFENRHWGKVSDRQRYRALALMANTYIRECKLEDAGKLLLRAHKYQPTDEKARINESLAYELLQKTEHAHNLACNLVREFSHSSSAWAVWIRTPENANAADSIKAIPDYQHSDSEVAVAIATIALRASLYEVAVGFARKATVANSKWPATWLTLGQALRALVFSPTPSQATLPNRTLLLSEARDAFARAIELAATQNAPHLEAFARVNSGDILNLLGEPNATERKGSGDQPRKSGCRPQIGHLPVK